MKIKKILVLFIIAFFTLIISNKAYATIPEGMSEEFKNILNEEGKLVITDTSNSQNKNQVFVNIFNKYETDEYGFQAYFIDVENTKCRIQRYEKNPYTILESYDIEIKYEEKYSDEFKQITKDGNILITSSSLNGKEMLLLNYCNLFRNDNFSFNITDLNEDKTVGTMQMYKRDGENYKFAEQHLIKITYEEKYSDEFKKVTKDGNITIRASRDDRKNNLIYNYCSAFSGVNTHFNVVDINEDGTLCTIQLYEQQKKENTFYSILKEQHIVKVQYDKTISENFKNHLNKNGKFVINSIKPTDRFEWMGLYEILFYNKGITADIEYLAEDFSSCEITIIDDKGYPETHKVEFEYNYDEKVKEFADTITNQIPTGEEYLFQVKDMELVNYWLNSEDESEKEGESNFDNYSGELKSFVDYKNFNLLIDHRLGADAEFFTLRGGIGLLQHKGTTYYINDYMGVLGNHILYVPDDTGSTKEELLEAVQKRVDEYAGRGKVKITAGEGSTLEYLEDSNNPDGENDFIKNAEGNYWFIATVNGINHKFIVVKDSKSMITPKHKTKDLKTDIEISTDSKNIPLDTIIEAKRLIEGQEYENIIKVLEVEENITFDLNLFSKSLNDYIRKLENENFEVKIPVPENLKNKKLIIYYVGENNKIEEYNVNIEDGYAIFKTNHFSTYTLAEEKIENNLNSNVNSNDKENIKIENTTNENNISSNINKEDNLVNPKTGDNIFVFIGIFIISILGIIITTNCRKKH